MSLSPPDPKRLCVGVVTAAQGIRGEVRVKSFTAEPVDVAAYGPLTDETGARTFTLRIRGLAKGVVVAAIDGVTDRNAAEALKGLRLHLARDQLPPTEDQDEFYYADLIGLTALLPGGGTFGRVVSVNDFGAGTSLEIEPAGGVSIMVPFTRAAVPSIDLAAGTLIVDPPAGLLEKPEPPEAIEAQITMAAEIAASGETTP